MPNFLKITDHVASLFKETLCETWTQKKTAIWEAIVKLESRLPGEISITSDMQMTPPLWQKMKKN